MDLLRAQLHHLATTPLFSSSTRGLTHKQRALLSYERAKAIASCYALTVDDIVKLTPKFWDMLSHPICSIDTATPTILAVQFNLSVGTIAQYSACRHDLNGLINDLVSYNTYGAFMLTEVGHGLDVRNLETTATYTPDGFILHTPTPNAAKFMPTTVPAGSPQVGVVFARLIVDGEDRGVRSFIVPLSDGKTMSAGISAKLLPHRGNTSPMNHCITTFNRVILPPGALLGSMQVSPDPHQQFLDSIWRLAVGAISLACVSLPFLAVYATIGARYSLRRKVGVPPTPILQFRTQQQPVLTAVAQAYVLRAFQDWAIKQFVDESQDTRVRHGIAACFKAVVVQQSKASCTAISDRCGAQGLLEHNQLEMLHAGVRGLAIGEGDILALSIRLHSELLLNRYVLPPPMHRNCLLARHERGLFDEQRQILSSLKGHRSSDFNRQLLPRSQFTIESIGHRMAYEAAIGAGVDKALVDLYEADIVQQDPSWYLAHGGLDRGTIFAMRDATMEAVLPRLESFVDGLGVGNYVTAPICSDRAWSAFVDGLETFGDPELVGSGQVEGIKARL